MPGSMPGHFFTLKIKEFHEKIRIFAPSSDGPFGIGAEFRSKIIDFIQNNQV